MRGSLPCEKMSADDENHLTGEALFLRAYYHFKLIMSWEKIIIRNEYLTGESQTHKALSTRTEAWDFICTELDKAGKIGRASCRERVSSPV